MKNNELKYWQRPEVIAKRKAYNKEYRKREGVKERYKRLNKKWELNSKQRSTY